MKLYYAGVFYLQIRLKSNQDFSFRRLEQYEEGALISLELKWENFEIDKINEIILC